MLSVSEARLLQDLRRRVEALEARAADRQHFEVLRRHNDARAAEGQRLRRVIAGLLAQHPGIAPPPAKRIQQALASMNLDRKLPSISAIRWHMRAIRCDNVNASALTPQR